MNLVLKTFLAACCVLSLSVSAELIHQNGGWRIKPGTSSGIIPDSRTDEVLKTIDRAENLSIMREDRAALAIWNKLVEKEAGTDVGAIALLGRARLYVQSGQFDDAEADLDIIFKTHSNFAGFGQAVQLAFDLAGQYDRGERRYLGGWFPWFKDPLHALSIYDKILKVAPVGVIAEESLIHAARLAEREDVELTTFSAVLAEPECQAELPLLVPGSWEPGSFASWAPAHSFCSRPPHLGHARWLHE